MCASKLAIVTGSNKGLGLAIVKGLCQKFKGTVYLTARDCSRGQAAVAELKKQGFKPAFHQLDVTNLESIKAFKSHLEKNHNGIDLLINNAGVAFHANSKESICHQVKTTMGINYFGIVNVTETLSPLLKNKSKIVNMSSSKGRLTLIASEKLRQKFNHPCLTIKELNELMNKYVKDAIDRRTKEEGWGITSYAASKIGVTALTFLQQRQFDKEKPFRDISVNAVHPGFVNTDLTHHKGEISVEEGAKVPLFVALEANFKGKFVWNNLKPIDWNDTSIPTPKGI